jgi:phage gpG-like protein
MQFQLDLKEVTNAVMKIYGDVDLYDFHQRVGEVVVSDIKRNVFDRLGYPTNTLLDYQNKAISWPSLALSTILQRTAGMRKGKSKQWNEKPSWPPPKGLRLQRTGNLRESINFRTTPNGVSIGSGMFYGKYLQARFPFLILTQSAMEEIAEQARLFFERVK